ncbi:hypothetical protein MIMGU_mgv1a017163mg [Erythranthe guttata]|uniref:Uncharacterized protein n=1 Tax=Erythranthe guttata TaxID=4155 RepID=A0A022RYV5_ERYGU|nr:hypothetical protein MIMGU_mgv1a017163mg [Erythranthe guttata]
MENCAISFRFGCNVQNLIKFSRSLHYIHSMEICAFFCRFGCNVLNPIKLRGKNVRTLVKYVLLSVECILGKDLPFIQTHIHTYVCVFACE